MQFSQRTGWGQKRGFSTVMDRLVEFRYHQVADANVSVIERSRLLGPGVSCSWYVPPSRFMVANECPRSGSQHLMIGVAFDRPSQRRMWSIWNSHAAACSLRRIIV